MLVGRCAVGGAEAETRRAAACPKPAAYETGGHSRGAAADASACRGGGIAILGLGARVPLGKRVSLGGAYEFPLTERRDIFRQRFTASVTLEF